MDNAKDSHPVLQTSQNKFFNELKMRGKTQLPYPKYMRNPVDNAKDSHPVLQASQNKQFNELKMRGKTQLPYPKYMRNPDHVTVFEVFGSSLRISCFLNKICRAIKEGKKGYCCNDLR